MTKRIRQLAASNTNRLKHIVCAVCAMLFALCSFAAAQQTERIPKIGYVSGSGDSKTPGRLVGESSKAFAISVISREKTFWLRIVTSRADWIGFPAS